MTKITSTKSTSSQVEVDDGGFELESLEPRLLLSADPLGTQVAADLSTFQPDRYTAGEALDAASVNAFISALQQPQQASDDAGSALPAALDLDAFDSINPVDNDSVLDLFAATTDSLAVGNHDDSESARHEVIFVDTRTPDYESLLADAQQTDSGIRYDIILLDADTDGIDQISDALDAYRDLDAVHVISHGNTDAVQLGDTWLQSTNLEQYASRIAGWQDNLSNEADLLFYGCNLAGSETGKALVEQLSRLSGADVAASEDLTGATGLGGDWTLEHQVGDIETGIVIGEATQQQWQGVLVSYVSETSSNASAAFDSANAFGQSFVHTSGSGTYDIDYIGIELDRDGAASGTITLTVRDGWDGVVVASATKDASTLNENPTLEIFHFAPVSLNDLQFYTIQVEVGPSSGTLNYGYDNTSPYFFGVLYQNGTADFSSDLAFEVGLSNGTPILTANTLDLAQGDVVVIDSTNLAATDADSVDGSLLFDITSVSNGYFAYAADTSTAIPSFTQDDITAGVVRFVHDGGELSPEFDVSVSDGSLASTAVAAIINFTGTADGVLWLSLSGNEGTGSGIPGLDTTEIEDDDILQQADQNFSLGETTTNGTFSLAFNASDFAGNENIDGMHYVTGTTTIGSTNAITLQAGDLILTNKDGATFTSNGSGAPAPLSVTDTDIFFFRPDTPGDYSTGNFFMLLSDPFGDGSKISAITLVERDVSVGGTNLCAGDVLLGSAAGGKDKDIWLLETSTLDPTVTASYPAAQLLIGGVDVGVDFDKKITGLDLLEQDTAIGGNVYDAGTLLVSFDADDNDGVGATAKVVEKHDIAALNVIKTSLETPVGNAQLTASIFFDGDNVNFTSGSEAIDGFTLTPDTTSTNLAPVLGSNNLLVTEGVTVTVTNAMLSASDVDSADAGLVFNVSTVTGGQFELTTNPGIAVSSFTQGQVLSNEVVFVDDGDENPPSFDISVSDGTNTTADVAGVVTFTNTNDAPTATNLSSTSTYNEGDASVAITDIVVSDVDSGENITATLTLANTATGSLSANDGASYTAATGVWTLTGTVANVNTALANLVFTPTTNNDIDTTISVSIDDGDEDASGPLTGTITLDVAPLNDAPTATNLSSTSSYNEGDASVAITDIVVSDVDTGETLTATLTLANTATGSLSANDGASYTAATGVWTLTGTVANVNTALANLVFTPTTNNDIDTTVSVSIDDGDEDASGPLTGTITLDVAPLNDAPTATNLSSTSSYNEGDASVAITDIVVSDVDSGENITATLTLANTATGSLSANDGASYTAATGVWTITDTVATVNTALANLVFTPTTNNDVDTTISVVIDDSDEDASGPLTGTITLDVTPLNDAPTATNLSSTSSYNEGDASVAITDIVVSDVDTGETLTATLTLANTATGSLSANDGASYTAATGVWTLTGTVANVNTALANLVFTPTTNNDIDTTISVSIDDGDEDASGPLTGTITLDVAPLNDAPTATNLSSTSSYNEGDASVAITDIVVSDVDSGENITATLTLANTATGSLSANDGASYTAATGVWTLTGTVANVNTALANLVFTPTTNNDIDTTISVSIDDGDEDASGPLTGTITLDVAPLNDAPTATNLSSTSSYNEGDASVAITDIVVSDVDTGETLTATLTLANTATGSLSANDGASYTAATGVWTLTGTVANVNTALANLVFTPAANNDANSGISVVIDDGDEDASGPLTGMIMLNVTPLNDIPTSADTSTSTNEDQAKTFAAGDFPFADVESAGIVALRIDSLPSNGVLMNGTTAINAGDVVAAANLSDLSFTPTANFNGTDSFTFNVFDGVDYSAAANTMTITVNAINDIPTSGDFSISSVEGVSTTFSVSDFPFADAEIPAIVALRIDTMPANGVLMSGTTVLNAGDVVVAADLGNLSYTPNAGFNGNDSFSFSVSDGTAYSIAPSTVSASVDPATTVTPVFVPPADPPVVLPPDGSVIDAVVDPVVAETTVEEVDTVTEDVTADETTSQDEPAQAAAAPVITVLADGLEGPQAAAAQPDHDANQRIGVDTSVKVNLQGLLQAIKIQLPGWDNLLLEAGEMFDPMNLLESNGFNRDMDQLREEAAEDVISQKMKAGTGVVLTTSLTVGYVAYLVRGGVLLSSVLSTLPVWNFIDPTPILASMKSGDDDEDDTDESLESLVMQDEQTDESEDANPNEETEV